MGVAISEAQRGIRYGTASTTRINEHYSIAHLDYADLIVNAHDPLVVGSLEGNRAELELLAQFAKGVVLDVGANVGSHSVYFSRTADVVFAFEPQPTTFYMLCGSIAMNVAQNVVPINCGLGSFDGETHVANLDPTKPNTLMGVKVENGLLPVPMRTLDSFELSPVHFIKIDVEGHELEVLKGARGTLERECPIVYVEIHTHELVQPIREMMKELAYEENEYITQYTEKEGEAVFLTAGYLFWKGFRIHWVNA